MLKNQSKLIYLFTAIYYTLIGLMVIVAFATIRSVQPQPLWATYILSVMALVSWIWTVPKLGGILTSIYTRYFDKKPVTLRDKLNKGNWMFPNKEGRYQK